MARTLGFLALFFISSICEATIFRPISDSHRSAALEIFKPIDGSFKRVKRKRRRRTMGAVSMEICGTPDDSSATLSFARSYQLEAFEQAMKQNTIVFLETGSGKTLIAVMLLRSYAHFLRRPTQSNIAVFLVPTVVLVSQQAEVIEMHTDLKVGKYWGDMGVDFWDAAIWKKQLDEHEVLVMTPKILLDALSHTYIKLDKIKLLIHLFNSLAILLGCNWSINDIKENLDARIISSKLLCLVEALHCYRE